VSAINGEDPWRIEAQSDPSSDWDDFVIAQDDASVYHLSGWFHAIKDVLGHKTYFLEARNAAGELVGIMPLVWQRSLIGSFAVSVPCFSYGGALCGTDSALRQALMEYAKELAKFLGCSYLELRDQVPHEGGWTTRTDKVSMVLSLPDSSKALGEALGSKLRSQIRRADRENPSVRSGGGELLNDFYDVFARNMRDVGTPVYPRRFFSALLNRFPDQCRIVAVYRGEQAAAAGFLVTWRRRTEVPWAGCRSDAKPLGFNMKLYWELLSDSIAAGSTAFDFGRSTLHSGTYRFKQQWGAQPVQLYWHRWARRPQKGRGGEHGPGMRMAIAIWQRLPLRVANTLGPLVSPGLPW
jgi:serine/alanine adding enzyme